MGLKKDELILKTAKEIVVKFIEMGNISPASFHDHFKNIFKTVEKTIKKSDSNSETHEKPDK
ncbi:MAG: conjugal transfer protein TraB [Dissulfuribacterales bacterium]